MNEKTNADGAPLDGYFHDAGFPQFTLRWPQPPHLAGIARKSYTPRHAVSDS
jgi:hypothetical protein